MCVVQMPVASTQGNQYSVPAIAPGDSILRTSHGSSGRPTTSHNDQALHVSFVALGMDGVIMRLPCTA